MNSGPASRACSNRSKACAALPSDSKSSPSSIRAMFAPFMASLAFRSAAMSFTGAHYGRARIVPEKKKGSRCREPLFLPCQLLLIRETDADAVHAADHVIQSIVGVLATGIRRTGVGDVVDIGIELGPVVEAPVATQVEVQDRVHLVEVDGGRLDRRRRAGAGGTYQGVAVGGHAAGIPAFRQVHTPCVRLIGLGFQNLPVQHVTAGLVVSLAVAAAAQIAGQFHIP